MRASDKVRIAAASPSGNKYSPMKTMWSARSGGIVRLDTPPATKPATAPRFGTPGKLSGEKRLT
jgi:hypothetical protein